MQYQIGSADGISPRLFHSTVIHEKERITRSIYDVRKLTNIYVTFDIVCICNITNGEKTELRGDALAGLVALTVLQVDFEAKCRYSKSSSRSVRSTAKLYMIRIASPCCLNVLLN